MEVLLILHCRFCILPFIYIQKKFKILSSVEMPEKNVAKWYIYVIDVMPFLHQENVVTVFEKLWQVGSFWLQVTA